MIPYINLEEQVDSDFVGARRRALLRRVMARFHNAHIHNRLLSFDEVREASLADSWIYIGTKILEAEKIVGSVGRQNDFDRSFLPIRADVEARWRRVDGAFRRIEDLPPVSLCKIGDAYFVLDGHHRVSVPRRTNSGGRGDRVSASNLLRPARRRGDLHGRAHIEAQERRVA